MKVAIIAAMEPEVAYYLERLTITAHKQVAQVEWWEAEYKNHHLLITQAGIGKVNAAIAATIMSLEKPDLIINSGSAGAIHPDREIGDVVVSDGAVYHDADATAFGYEVGQIPQMPFVYPSAQEWSDKLLRIYEAKGYQAVSGLVLTADQFVADTQKVEQLAEQFPEAQCTEMEGAAIAQVAYQFNLPCLIVRAISDTAQMDAAVLFDEFIEKAGKISGEATLELIKG